MGVFVNGKYWIRCWIAVLLLGLQGVPHGSAAQLRWHDESHTLDANFDGEPLGKVLADLGALTGWEVFVEPGMTSAVFTRFEGLSVNQGLRRLLGDLNFAVVSGPSGANKLLIFRDSARAATQALHAAPAKAAYKSQRIGNELIVTLDPDSPETIEQIAARLGAEVVGKIDDLNTYRLRFKDDATADSARESLATVDYARVDDNYAVEVPDRLASLNFGNQPTPRVSATSNPNQEQVIVGLIDTPVQDDGTGIADFLLPTLSVAGEASPPLDEPTHGTTMAETLLRGMQMVNEGEGASGVRILPVDVYGPEEMTSTFQVAAGVVGAIDAGASIINLSLGGQDTTPFLQQIISSAHQQGIVFVGAAGNDAGTHNVFPAAYPEVVAVTSSDRFGGVASYANRGSFVDVMVPGHSFVHFNGESYIINGTSASAAYVSGITAGIAATSGLPASQVENQVRLSLPKPPGP